MSLFRCPLCTAPLQRVERAYRCPTGHSFDIAAEGHHPPAAGEPEELQNAR